LDCVINILYTNTNTILFIFSLNKQQIILFAAIFCSYCLRFVLREKIANCKKLPTKTLQIRVCEGFFESILQNSQLSLLLFNYYAASPLLFATRGAWDDHPAR
jgi:hypothetical protein